MTGNYYQPFSLRVSENLMDKIKIIAKENRRSANKEIEFALSKYIEKYEAENGEINMEN